MVSELPHLLLGSEFVVAFVYAMLQRQYLLGLNDPKLLESLLYLLQTMSSCHGSASGTVSGTVSGDGVTGTASGDGVTGTASGEGVTGTAGTAGFNYGGCGRERSSADVKRIESALDNAPWAALDMAALAALREVDCRELLWRELRHTAIILPQEVNCRCPHSIVGVGACGAREA